MKKSLAALLAVILGVIGMGTGCSGQREDAKRDIYQAVPGELQWGSHPALPKQFQVAVVYGDPGKDGPVVLRIKAPAGSKIPPHFHAVDENVTVLSGSMHAGSGDQFDEAKGMALPVGTFVNIPAKHHHYAWFTEDSVVQLNNFGKWDIIYIDPKDDPRHQ